VPGKREEPEIPKSISNVYHNEWGHEWKPNI
jgi:hypothetical protein